MAGPLRSVRNAWWRQSGHSCCWVAPASRVRRTTNPEPPGDGTFAGAGDVGALSDWGLPVGRAVDVGPRALRDRGDRGSDAFGGASDGRRQAMV